MNTAQTMGGSLCSIKGWRNNKAQKKSYVGNRTTNRAPNPQPTATVLRRFNHASYRIGHAPSSHTAPYVPVTSVPHLRPHSTRDLEAGWLIECIYIYHIPIPILKPITKNQCWDKCSNIRYIQIFAWYLNVYSSFEYSLLLLWLYAYYIPYILKENVDKLAMNHSNSASRSFSRTIRGNLISTFRPQLEDSTRPVLIGIEYW